MYSAIAVRLLGTVTQGSSEGQRNMPPILLACKSVTSPCLGCNRIVSLPAFASSGRISSTSTGGGSVVFFMRHFTFWWKLALTFCIFKPIHVFFQCFGQIEISTKLLFVIHE